MGSVSKSDRNSMLSASMRKFLKEEKIMIAKIDAFRDNIPDKKKKKDNQRKSRRP